MVNFYEYKEDEKWPLYVLYVCQHSFWIEAAFIDEAIFIW